MIFFIIYCHVIISLVEKSNFDGQSSSTSVVVVVTHGHERGLATIAAAVAVAADASECTDLRSHCATAKVGGGGGVGGGVCHLVVVVANRVATSAPGDGSSSAS